MEEPYALSSLTSALSIFALGLDFVKSAISSLAWPVCVLIIGILFRSELITLMSKLASIKAGSFEASFGQTVHELAKESPPELPLGIPGDPDRQDNVAEDVQAPPAPPPFAPEPFALLDDEVQGDATGRKVPGVVETSTEDVDIEQLRSIKELRRWAIGEANYRDFRDARKIAKSSPSGAVLLAWRAVENAIFKAGLRLKIGSHLKNQALAQTMQQLVLTNCVSQSAYYRFLSLRKLRNAVAHQPAFDGSYEDVMEYINLAEELANELGRDISSPSIHWASGETNVNADSSIQTETSR